MELNKNGMLGDYKVKANGKIVYEIDGELLRVEGLTLAQEVAAIDEREMIIAMVQAGPRESRRWRDLIQAARDQIAKDKRGARKLVRDLKKIQVSAK